MCIRDSTYIGAMIAMREGGHLGVDTLIKKPVSYTHLDVYKRQARIAAANWSFGRVAPQTNWVNIRPRWRAFTNRRAARQKQPSCGSHP